MKHRNVRGRLIENSIKVIAENGLDKTTTKAIVEGTGINEGYIYSYFKGKEDLLAQMFESLDIELADKLLEQLPIMNMQDIDMQSRCHLYFGAVWQFLMGNRDKCLAYIRYYYSPYYIKNSVATHKQRFAPIVEKFSYAFQPESDAWMILNHILNVMLNFAIMVHSGQVANSNNFVEHVFRVVYRSIEQYFK